jgi:hypothetical protein
MSHVESASSHNPAPDLGPPTSTESAIIENLHRILGRKRTEIKQLKEKVTRLEKLLRSMPKSFGITENDLK